MDFIKDGRFRALAVTSGSRSSNLPDTPTISETGFPGYAVTGWQGLVAPAGLPEPVLTRLHAALTGVLAEPTVVGQFRTLGNEPRSSTPEEFKARLVAEIQTWAEVVAAANIERI
jgi:tripartite-type tricarboxylate transporter receptor subunit TctC